MRPSSHSEGHAKDGSILDSLGCMEQDLEFQEDVAEDSYTMRENRARKLARKEAIADNLPRNEAKNSS